MISKDMYKVLKKIPHEPNNTNLPKLSRLHIIDATYLQGVIEKAMEAGYIEYCVKNNPYKAINKSDFRLIEKGQVAIEEYKSLKGSSAKSTWALIIAGLSFIASVVAIIL